MTQSRIPEPSDPFEDEGLPATESVLASKVITGDPQEGMAAPADTPLYSDSYGVTAAEQARGESIDSRVRAEEPDVLAALDDPADESPDADQPFSEGADQRVGRLVDIDEGAGPDLEADAVGYDAGTDLGGFSAEEAAMHIEREPNI